jgi:LysM domain
MRGSDRRIGQIGRLIRQLAVLVAAVALTGMLVRWGGAAWSDLRALPDRPAATPDDALADVAAVLALAAWTWLLLGAVVTVVEALSHPTGRPLAPRIAPAAWRRLVVSIVGIGMLSAPAGLAQASPGGPGGPASSGGPARLAGSDPGSLSQGGPAQAIRGLPLPDRPFSRQRSESPSAAAPGAVSSPNLQVTVRPGDSLWAIAARHLDPRATDQAIADEWRRWYAANRTGIGPNPDLIYPGMVLRAPTRKATS